MKHLIRIMSLSGIMLGIMLGGFFFTESMVAYAIPPATNAVIVTLNVDTGITISAPGNTTMSTSLGVAANEAVGTTTWDVVTNDPNGYTLGVSASTNPAMKSGSNFVADYSTTTNPSTWSVASGDARFGFSAFGTDVLARYGSGSFCNGAATSTTNNTLDYYGFYTNATTTSSRSSTTTPSGVNTTICYAVQQNNFFIPAGVYTATITGTATAL